MFDLKKAFEDYSEHSSHGFAGGRDKTIGASQIGKCARKTVAELNLRRAKKPIPKLESLGTGAAVRGNVMEDHFSAPFMEWAIEKQVPGAKLIWARQADQKQFKSEAWRMSATPDGLIVNAPRDMLVRYGVEDIMADCVVVDFKSYDPRKDETKFPEQAHVDQVVQQTGLIRAAGEYEPLWGLLVYVNSSFYDDIKVIPVPFRTDHFEDLKRRANALWTAEHHSLVRPEGSVAGGKECMFCWMKDQCVGYSDMVPEYAKDPEELELKGRTRKMLQTAVGVYDNCERQLKSLSERKEQAKAVIKEALTDADTRKAQITMKDGKVYNVNWYKNKGRLTVDNQALIAEFERMGGDKSQFQKRTKPSDTLTLKIVDTSEKNETLGTKVHTDKVPATTEKGK